MAFFTGAIFAIATTPRAVELERPDEERRGVRARAVGLPGRPAGLLSAFALAFLLPRWVWRRHHQLKDIVRRPAKGFAFRHAPVLLLVAFQPLPTAVIGASITNPMAQTCSPLRRTPRRPPPHSPARFEAGATREPQR
ncbi:TMEM175 family protein [Nonomuraea sp. NPDC001684]